MMLTRLRKDGRELGARLASVVDHHAFVIAIPRRGVVVGAEVARALRAPFDVLLATKVGADDGAGETLGALALGGAPIRAMRSADVPPALAAERFAQTQRRLEARLAFLRGDAALPDLRDRAIVLVDDAVVSGLTIEAAIDALARRKAASITVATPLASREAAARVRPSVDRWIALAEVSEAEADTRHTDASSAICPPIADEEIHAMLADAWRVASPALGALELDGI